MASVEQIKAAVASRGGWDSVFCYYPDLSRHIDNNPTRHGYCPKTGKGKDCFRFFRDWKETGGAVHNGEERPFVDGIALLTWLTGKSTAEVLQEIDDLLGGVNVDKAAVKRINRNLKRKAAQYCTPAEAEERRERLMRNMDKCVNIIGTPGETYLRNRGITMPLEFLQDRVLYSPELYYAETPKNKGDKPITKKLQGLCTKVYCKKRKLLTLHRTFLTKDGRKAPVSGNKMMFASTRTPTGGCAPLDLPVDTPFGKLIGVCEGLETGLSVRQATGCPMWIGIADKLMERVNCQGVDVVLIWADKDLNQAGEKAAERMQQRLASQGIHSVIYTPEVEGKADWNDILVNYGEKAFPQPLQPEWKVYGGDK